MTVEEKATVHELPVGLARASVHVLVLDRHPLTRIGLGVVLHRQSWVAKCLLAADIDEAVRLAARHRPDLAVVDAGDAGPAVDGYLAPLKAVRPTLAFVLSNLSSAPVQPQLTVVDRRRLITAEQSIEAILATLRAAVMGDGGVVDGAEVERSDYGLSVREREVLALLCTGATNREIAAALHVGPETVKKHARSLYRKLGARNRTEAARRASELAVA